MSPSGFVVLRADDLRAAELRLPGTVYYTGLPGREFVSSNRAHALRMPPADAQRIAQRLNMHTDISGYTFAVEPA